MVEMDQVQYPQTHSALVDLSTTFALVLDAIQRNEVLGPVLQQWALASILDKVSYELIQVTSPNAGFHFGASHTTEEAVLAFDIHDHASKIESMAPILWALFTGLFSTEPKGRSFKKAWRDAKRRKVGRKRADSIPRRVEVEMEDIGFSDDEDLLDGMVLDEDEDEPEDWEDQIMRRRRSNVKMRQVFCISALMNTINNRCNALQSVNGVYLHAASAPDRVHELFSKVGLSISIQSTNNAIQYMSKTTIKKAKALGLSFLSSYAFDNLDIGQAKGTPTIDSTSARISSSEGMSMSVFGGSSMRSERVMFVDLFKFQRAHLVASRRVTHNDDESDGGDGLKP
ncbi:hypothetical protein CC1G_08716 [Coprinopsis cinerea okayama7|uniref:Uncharacterized protein n=1 Tax=Coprinopsis cinerea (strain Okayama-7 / 130 / ATCC MYA-4618 / FGSC 9003) TaxID=240176 RepID=A8NIW3_COPC7|nr:hypothetical protein CC1G_08716 [Coprinopsis cinerea okayama7\|eukprot:XP_001834085.2 hypothetical protein CC1G_08716 [Coprinopsis cinerea okayama7\